MGDKLTYIFEIDAKTPGLDDLLGKLDKSNAKLHGAAGAAKHAEEGFKGVGGALSSFKESLTHIAEFTGAALLFEGIEKGIDLIKELGREAIGAAAKAERLDLSFELTLGQEGAKDTLEWLDKIAGRTEFTDDSLKGWALQLANAGLKGEQLKDTVAAALDVAGKRGPQAMQLAVDALERATLSGKIEGRALRGLGIPVADLAQLDQFKGLNEKQINKKLESVMVTKEDLLSLIAGADNLLGDKGVKAAGTLEAKLTHLKDLPDQFFQRLKNTEAFSTLTAKADEFLQKLDPESPAGQRIFGALEEVFTRITGAIDSINFDDVANVISNDIVPAMETFGEVAKATLETFKGIASVFEFLGGGTKAKDIPRTAEEVKLDNLYEVQKRKLREIRAAKAEGKENPYELPFGPSKSGADRIKEAADEVEKKGTGIGFDWTGRVNGGDFAKDFGQPMVMPVPTMPSMGSPSIPPMLRASGPTIHVGDIHVSVGSAEDADEGGRAAGDAVKAHVIRALEHATIEGGGR